MFTQWLYSIHLNQDEPQCNVIVSKTNHRSSHYPSMAKEYSLSRVNTINTAMPAYKTGLHSTAWLYNHKADGTGSPSSDGTGS